MHRPIYLFWRGAGRASEAASGVEELKALDVAVTGLGLERAIERGEAQVAAVRARYESSQASDAAAVHKAARKKKVRVLGSCTVRMLRSSYFADVRIVSARIRIRACMKSV